MIKCENCGNILSDGFIVKAVSVIQINYKEQLCNIKCRKCKSWCERIPLSDLIRLDLIRYNTRTYKKVHSK
jgi:hypothetical protein